MPRWTDEDIATLRALYPDARTADIAQRLGRSIHQVHSKAHNLRLRKSAAFNASPLAYRLDGIVGKETRFKKGHASWNKGKHGFKPGGRAAETQFEKGHMPHNWVPIGTEQIRDGYLVRKVTDTRSRNDWQAVHILLWIDHYGPVPEKHAIIFRDGNRKNIVIDNLELISRRELMLRNTIHRYPPELKQAIRLVSKLKRKIEAVDEKQN